MNMYMKDATEEAAIYSSPSIGLALVISVVMVLVIGIMPSVLVG